MRGESRMERFPFLPFSMGCASQSSVDVAHPNHHHHHLHPPNTTFQEWVEEDNKKEEDEEEVEEKNRAPKLRKLLKNFKNLSQLLLYKEDGDEDEDEMMEIGHPTDVKHVTHIGLDGSATSIMSKNWTPPCTKMMMMDLHHHDIFFSTTPSPSPTTATTTTPATNPPSPPAFVYAVHDSASSTR